MKRYILGLLLFLLVVVGCIGVFRLQSMWSSVKSTRTAEEALTEVYKDTASSAIYRFEMTWSSLEAYRDPQMQAQVATDPFLERVRFKHETDAFNTQDYWQVTKAVTVTSVIVYEYAPTRFKAGACTDKDMERVTPQGVFHESVSFKGICGIYVFIWEQNNWILAGAFNTTMHDTALRDWHQLPDEFKEVIGELPDHLPDP